MYDEIICVPFKIIDLKNYNDDCNFTNLTCEMGLVLGYLTKLLRLYFDSLVS